jgi:hypothetical protein
VRKLRGPLLGAVAGAILALGGQALASIPDATPSSPDPSHTFRVCVRQGTVPQHAMEALDTAQGTGHCNSGWDEKQLVPAIPAP